MVDDWSKRWDERDDGRSSIRRDWRAFIGGFVTGGFCIFAIIVFFDGIMRWLYA